MVSAQVSRTSVNLGVPALGSLVWFMPFSGILSLHLSIQLSLHNWAQLKVYVCILTSGPLLIFLQLYYIHRFVYQSINQSIKIYLAPLQSIIYRQNIQNYVQFLTSSVILQESSKIQMFSREGRDLQLCKTSEGKSSCTEAEDFS